MKKKVSERLVWIDLEMTGLDPQHDSILEIATIITDNNLTVIAEGPSLIINASGEALDGMNEVVKKMHATSGLTEKVKASTLTLKDAEQQTLDFIKKHVPPQSSPLCGSTIYMDRIFLRAHMPSIDTYLDYRLIDVSSVKELVLRWYQNNPHAEFKKKDTHRALDDIRGSIEELNYYRKNFFLNSPHLA